MSRAQGPQENFWKGAFGDDYTERNQVAVEARKPFFQTILGKAEQISSVLEVGANRGHNLAALRQLNSGIELTGLEINKNAHIELEKLEGISAVLGSIQDYRPDRKFDLVFTAGVLIHLNPTDLPAVYQNIAGLADKYVMFAEYFNPTPLEIPYRGHGERLFKRDFAGEFLDHHGADFGLVDYGFLWKRDNPAWDDVTWFLLKRNS